VAAERPEQVFLLGDVFHGTRNITDKWVDETFAKLVAAASGASVSTIFALGGNHDRAVFDARGNAWQQAHGTKLRVFNRKGAPLLVALPAAKGSKQAILTHDGGNNLWLTGSQVVPFLLGIKEANGIAPDVLLVAGHTHKVVDLSCAAGTMGQSRVASLGCFTGCSKHTPGLDYGMVEETANGDFVYRPGSAL
jgi:hypothetical protein